MKFGRNLDRVSHLADQSNPGWSPFWVNYKALKKIVTTLPPLVPNDPPLKQQREDEGGGRDDEDSLMKRDNKSDGDDVRPSCTVKQSHTESLNEKGGRNKKHKINLEENNNTLSAKRQRRVDDTAEDTGIVVQEMMRRPGEIAFFRLLHSELNKAQRFFDGAQKEVQIQEERIRESIQIVKSSSFSSEEKAWSNIFKSLYKLNTKLLLLETYAIMSFCAFSKILKKHDKVTGYNTRKHFMEKLVKTSNFADYPELREMISRCESCVKEVLSFYSHSIVDEQGQKKSTLFEDEQLFIHMVEKLNVQARETAVEEGATKINRDHSGNRKKQGFINIENATKSKSKLTTYLYSIVDQYGTKIE
mmetsp:Transcript_19332/g.28607  ORF Transcript_19332/g.28607 Transcript_19332/m.28607 type:complete len:360 (-) Transcript_19332:6-1085(-)